MAAAGDDGSVLGRLLPAAVVGAERFDDPPEAELFEQELAAVARAVPKRQAEYRTVRYCARLALDALGVAPVPILSGERREPLWPAGVVGNLTHCDGYRAAAVARRDRVLGVGIDAEPHRPLPDGVLDQVSDPAEQAMLAELAQRQPGTCWDRLLFCAKEAVYKVWYPLARRWLGFEDAEVALDQAGTFRVRLLVEPPLIGGRGLTRLDGSWVVQRGLIVTAITLCPDAVR
jgi:4'-phosphopantetheinyl transferase EntD